MYASQPGFGALHAAVDVRVTLLPRAAVASTDDNMLQQLGADLASQSR